MGLPLLYYWGRPVPLAMRTEPFQGITYYRRVHFTPYPLVAHIVLVDLQAPGIGFLVTPGDAKEEFTLVATTTLPFPRSMDVQIAINGDELSPWWWKGPFDYFPRSGDRVAPTGFAISIWRTLWLGFRTDHLFLGRRCPLQSGDVDQYNTISGNQMVVVDGKAVDGLDNSYPAPRTAIGLDEERKHLILFVADGRQPLYSDGATLQEMANLLVYYRGFQCHEHGWRWIVHAGDAEHPWAGGSGQFPHPHRLPRAGTPGGQSARDLAQR